MSQQENYIVTGAAGFIGSRVCALLLDQGHKVVGIDTLNDTYDVKLKTWRLSQIKERTNFSFYSNDISNPDCLWHVLRSQDCAETKAVINLAARTGVRQSVKDPRVYYQVNVLGTLNLLEACQKLGIKKFVLASTSSLYGAPKGGHRKRPFKEHDRTDAPLSPYAASKKAAETLCYSYHHLHGLDITILRYFTVYGPAGRPDMSLFRFVQWIREGKPVTIFGDGQQSRDFTYVDDVARGTVAGIKPLGYEIINLGSDRPVRIIEVVKTIERALNKKADLIYKDRYPADVLATWADITKAKELLGWRPQIDIQEGIDRLVEWYKENRNWAKDLSTGDDK